MPKKMSVTWWDCPQLTIKWSPNFYIVSPCRIVGCVKFYSMYIKPTPIGCTRADLPLVENCWHSAHIFISFHSNWIFFFSHIGTPILLFFIELFQITHSPIEWQMWYANFIYIYKQICSLVHLVIAILHISLTMFSLCRQKFFFSRAVTSSNFTLHFDSRTFVISWSTKISCYMLCVEQSSKWFFFSCSFSLLDVSGNYRKHVCWGFFWKLFFKRTLVVNEKKKYKKNKKVN